ncbi:MAG: histidine kinase, partial [Solirubrobacterales bacterium]|nr:histidine kinase [Solirubrobacterales bacterium]
DGADGAGAVSPGDGPVADILVADDNADMRGYIAGLLAGRHTVRTAADGVEALRLAREQAPDLVLTDVMMPRLDGFGLLKALQQDPATVGVPVVMLSARSGEEGTVGGLEAGASDYLVKPFTARELLARVNATLELDRVRRTRDELQRSRTLLDQAQRLAGVASWDLDLETGQVFASHEFLRQLELDAAQLDELPFEQLMLSVVHPDDLDRVQEALRTGAAGAPIDYEVRLRYADGRERLFRTLGELERDPDGRPLRLRGSNQDITEQRAAERALAAAAAAREAAARESAIADQLQRSLLPAREFALEHLAVAAAYEAGVAGTQVGGDWYDVIELGAGRTALVIGDVMGRGVPAAAVMGQLRAAVRAYARLDLEPAVVLELLDAAVRDLGEDQIVTCVYAVYDPMDRSLVFANAGHLPPILQAPGEAPRRLTEASGPPLGSGPLTLRNDRVPFPPGSLVALYTDGLVERRDQDIDAGIDAVAARLAAGGPALEALPQALMDALLSGGPEDDVAILLARAGEHPAVVPLLLHVEPEPVSVRELRRAVVEALQEWATPPDPLADAVLLSSELVTNALIHGRGPIEYRLRRDAGCLVLEVQDAASVLPQKRQPTAEDEHGRGLQLVDALAHAWGTRPLPQGKAVWCTIALEPGARRTA